MLHRSRWVLTTSLMLGAMTAEAAAPAGEDGALEEVLIVSTFKKEQPIQEIPASVAAFSSEDLARSGLVNSFDLQQLVPGLSISMANRETNVAIRGVSNNVRSVGADPSNAVHLDGIYLPQSNMVLTEFFDVGRVEVLKGPEGTLYGRNATGGVLNVVSRAPTAGFSAEGFAGVGSFNARRAQFALNGGSDRVAGRVAVAYSEDDGYTKNLQTGRDLDATDFLGFRGQVRFQISEQADLTLLAHLTRDDGTVGYGVSGDPSLPLAIYPYNGDPAYGFSGQAEQRQSPRRIRIDSDVASQRDSDVFGATLNWRFGDVTLTSVTGVTRYEGRDFNDFDFTGRLLETQLTTTNVESLSQELRLAGGDETGLEWLVGAFYYEDEGDQSLEWLLYNEGNFFGTPDPAALARINTFSDSQSFALFGQATWHLSERWALLVGGRYNDEDKAGRTRNLRNGATAQVAENFSEFTPKVQVQFTPNDELLVYAGATRGFKSGGFNLLAFPAPAVFQPELVTAYELGVKSTLADGRVLLNGAVFHYDYEDLQLRTLVLSGGGPVATVSNAAAATITGLELFLDANLSEAVSIDAAVTYLDTELENFVSPSNRRDLAGSPLPLSPEWSGVVGLNVAANALGGSLRARAELAYRGRIIFPLSIDQTFNFDEASTVVNATLRWTAPSESWYVELIGRNLSDDLYRTQRSDVPFANVFEGFGPPRTGELRVGFKF